jgi:diguanylate cyclase (GGDEF)-like protein/PAS domain S-box-containing protein
MRKALSTAFFVSVFLVVFAEAEYRLGGDVDYPPFEYENERGIPVGFNVDILRAISKALDFEIEIELRTWTNAPTALESGQIDGLLGMYYSEGRNSLVDSSIPHIVLHGSIFSIKLAGKFSSLNDLREPRIAIQKGDLTDEIVSTELVGSEIMRVEYPEIALRVLNEGQVDAVLLGTLQGLFLLEELSFEDVVMSDNPFIRLEYCFAVREGDRELLSLLNEGLSIISSNGEYRRTYNKWVGGIDGSDTSGFWPSFSLFFLPAGIIALLVLGGVYLWNRALKRQIREKTASLSERLEEKKLVEAQLLLSIKRYKSMSETISDYYYEVEYSDNGGDPEVWRSDSYERISGYSIDEPQLQKFDWESIVHPDDLDSYRRHLESVRSGNQRQLEYRIIRKDGALRWVSEFSRPSYSDGASGIRSICGAIRNITDEKLAKEELEKTKEKVSKLHYIALKMEKSNEEDTIYHSIIDASVNIFGMDKFGLYLYYNQELVTLETKGEVSTLQGYLFRSGILRDSIESGSSTFIDAASLREVVPDCSESISIVPMKNIGAFVSYHESPMKQEEVKLVETLMAHAVEAIIRIRSDREIHYVTFHDPLTSLYNRSFFEEEVERLNVRRQMPMSIVMGDVNGLKIVNDAFGHLEGDRLLKAVSECLKSSLRSDDIIARWGGDEFIMLLPQTNTQSAESLVSRIKKALTQITGFDLPISVSFGIGTKSDVDQDFRETLVSAEEKMYRDKLLNNISMRSRTVKVLEKSLLNKSYETEEHTEKIKSLSRDFGKFIGLSEAELDNLLLLGALHDIGKIAVPEEILTKAGSLTSEEWKKIKSHPEAGFRIALSSPELVGIADEILSHHEWWDGSGYPRGLVGESIPLLARIMSIIDAYDVMTSGRPYKHPVSCEEAIEELRRCSGKQFDPGLVDSFVNLLSV